MGLVKDADKIKGEGYANEVWKLTSTTCTEVKKHDKKQKEPFWNDSQPFGGKNVCLSWQIAAY